MTRRSTPNVRLRALLSTSGWTGQDLAHAVNAAGAECGLALRYDRTSVAHWLAGSRPPAHIAVLVAECFSRVSGRRVDVAETALAREGNDGGAEAETDQGEDAVARLVHLAGTGPGRRAVVRALAYTTAASLPTFAAPPARLALPGQPTTARVGSAQWRSAELMLDVFATHDAMFGGGARPALSAYLATDVAGWLSAPSSARNRHRLMLVAARLTYVAGYMCFDENLNGAAQAYYRTAAQLAAEAGDPGGYTAALRAMSIQAYHLGHRSTARQLADAATSHSHRLAIGHSAQLSGQLAVAAAGVGDRRTAFAELTRAQRLLAKGENAHGTLSAYHLAALAHQEAETLAATGDRPGAISALTLSLRHRPGNERRARALTTARLAELHLDEGHLEQACATWHAFLDDQTHLLSARATDALASLRARLRPYQRTAVARNLLERARLTGSVDDCRALAQILGRGRGASLRQNHLAE